MQQGNSAAFHSEGCGQRSRREARQGDWYCIATGPSLSVGDARKARQAAKESGGKVIAINDNYRHPELIDSDYLYACDKAWWTIHYDRVKEVFKGELWTQYHNDDTKRFADKMGINAIEGKGGTGLGKGFVYHGSNSGHQAINLAYHLATTVYGEHPRIFLLGYDMGATGQTHWFGDHPKNLTNGNHAGFVPQFTRIAEDLERAGVECINLTRQTKLTQFPRSTIDDYSRIHSEQ